MSGDLPRGTILVGDAAQRLASLPTDSVHMVLTSPPYFNLRDYGHEDQIGLERHVDQWASHLQTIVQQLARVLRPDGTFWLNVDDSYSYRRGSGAPKKSLLLAPERLALALIQDGWLLRNKLIWHKSNGLPSSVTDRLTHKWEYVYVFARSREYYFDLDALRRPHASRPPKPRSSTGPGRPPKARWQGAHGDRGDGIARMKAAGRVGHDLGANPGDVWTIPTSAWRGAHHATFPVRLAEQAITGGCPEAVCAMCGVPWRRRIVRELGAAAVRSALEARCTCPESHAEPGLVLDPFLGSGTTAIAAERLGRDWLGIELSPRYARVAQQRIDIEHEMRPSNGTERRNS